MANNVAMTKKLRAFLAETSAATVIEYALTAGAVSIGIVFALLFSFAVTATWLLGIS